MKESMDPSQVLGLAQRAMGPSEHDRRQLDAALLAAGVGIPAALSSGLAHAAAHTASSAIAGSAAAVGGASMAATLGAKTSVITGLSAKASTGLGLLGSVGAGKLTVAAAIVGASVVGITTEYGSQTPHTAVVMRETDDTPRPSAMRSEVNAVASATTAAVLVESSPEAPPEVDVSPLPRVAVDRVPAARAAAQTEPAPVQQPVEQPVELPVEHSAATLKLELQALRGVDAALSSGDGATALRLLRELNTRVPEGSMLPERRVSEVLALCQTGQTARAQQLAQRLITGDGGFYTRRLMNTCALGAEKKSSEAARDTVLPTPKPSKSTQWSPKPRSAETK